MIKKKLLTTGLGFFAVAAFSVCAFGQDPTPTATPSPAPTITPVPSPTISPMPPMTPSPSPTPGTELVAANIGGTITNKSPQDDKWTVIEYPEGKEVVVELSPPYQVKDAVGTAAVMRTADGTNIKLQVAGLPADAKDFYVYAVDPAGTVNLLGQITMENGANKTEISTALSKFMLLISPNDKLATYDDPTAIVFRSKVPDGYAVIPK